MNQSETDLCLFYKTDTMPITVIVDGVHIISKKSINILGVIFDSKLNWTEQVTSVIYSANKSLNTIKIIR